MGFLCGSMSRTGGEALKASLDMDFRAMMGLKSPSQNVKTFDNNLFASDSRAGSAGGSWISKINGYLERCSERPRLIIPPKMIVEDGDYFSKHSLYCMFLGMRVSL